ncbi:hypothetical protein CCH79_00008396 [Gambusia affinis]|uniref:Apple domain-containing protein n=1 Tax=Gambusia affinis TaxID=33528 RepID=A0A315UVV8_GAMAF|nr:hypothetical protein CCH79_00008396 [Gambusia affinis]
MKTPFILVTLLCFCAGSFGCDSELRLEWDFPGSDINILFSPDAKHCQFLCTQEATCLFWTFIRPDCIVDDRHYNCFLKATPSGKPEKQNPKQGTTAGYSLKSCNPLPPPSLSKVYEDVNFPGADYRTFFTVDYKACQKACTDDPFCQFFSYHNGKYGEINYRYKCYLKYSWSVPRTPSVVASADRISGFSRELQIIPSSQTVRNPFSPNHVTVYEGVDFPYSDLRYFSLNNAESCENACTSDPNCQFYSYVTSRGLLPALPFSDHKMPLLQSPGDFDQPEETSCPLSPIQT